MLRGRYDVRAAVSYRRRNGRIPKAKFASWERIQAGDMEGAIATSSRGCAYLGRFVPSEVAAGAVAALGRWCRLHLVSKSFHRCKPSDRQNGSSWAC